MKIIGALCWNYKLGLFEEKTLHFEQGVFVEDSQGGEVSAQGFFITPGLIDAHSHLGMWEESLGFEGADGNEMTDPCTPHLRALDGINPMDEAFSGAREGGVTCVASGPGSTNPLGGQWLVMKTVGTVLDDMVLNPFVAQKCALGENPKRYYGASQKAPQTRMAVAAMIRQSLVEAKDYQQRKAEAKTIYEKPVVDVKKESLIPLLERKVQLKAHAHRADDILTIIRIAKEFDLNLSLEHCTEGHLIQDAIAESGFPVVVGPSFGFKSKVELKHMGFGTVKALHDKGILVALMTDHPVLPQGSLRLWAIEAVKIGVEKADALDMITRNPAKILGIDHRLGSLDLGKDADFVIWDKDPFDPFAKVLACYIGGEVVYRQ